MRKTIIAIIVMFIFMILSISVTAAEVIEVDIKTAINTVLENDLDFKLTTINYEKANLEYEKSKANYLLQQSRYNELQMESSRNSAENTYQNSKKQLVKNIFSEYTNLYLAGLDLVIRDINFQIEKIRLAEAEAQYQIGDIGSIELLDRENSYKDTEFNMAIAQDDYQQGLKEFADRFGLEDRQLKLKKLNYSQSWQISEEEVVEAILENSFILRSREDQLSLAEIDLERAGVSAAALDKKIKEKSVEAAKIELEKGRQELVKEARQSYYQFKQAVKRIELSKERLTGAEEKYRLREEQYKAGLITRLEVLEYEGNMLQTRYNYLSAIINYYTQELNLRQEMGLDIEVLLDEITK